MIDFQLYGQGGAKVSFLRPGDKAEGGLGAYLDRLDFEGKKGEMVYLPSPEGAGQVALGLGEKDLTLEMSEKSSLTWASWSGRRRRRWWNWLCLTWASVTGRP